MYKIIVDSDTPVSLLSLLSDKLNPLPYSKTYDKVWKDVNEGTVDEMEGNVYKNYLHFFIVNSFYIK